MEYHQQRYKYLFSFSVILYLVVFNSWTNSSKTDAYLEIEQLSEGETMDLNRLFYAEKAQQIDSFLQLSNFLYKFNGTALVAINNQVVLEGGYGYADFAEQTPLTPEHSFQLASVSKQFTAMAILMLYEQGKLELQDPMNKHIPELPYSNVTIEHLLNHTAGMPNYLWLMEAKWKKNHIPDNEDLIRFLSGNRISAYFSSGRLHDYSNTGYALLASIVERVSGKSYSDFLNESIFGPLGMTNSWVFQYRNKDSFAERIRGYHRSGRYYREIEPGVCDGIVGDKGIYSSVKDLALWDKALYANRLVADTTLAKAFTPGKLNRGREIPYGYGFRLRNDNDQRIVYHNGRWEGFRNAFHRYIEEGNTIILLSNTECKMVDTMRKKIELVINETPINDDLLVIRAAIKHGYAFGKQIYMQKSAENPEYRMNYELLESSIQLLEKMEKQQLSLILKQLKEFV